jgi:hypothetical protein
VILVIVVAGTSSTSRLVLCFGILTLQNRFPKKNGCRRVDRCRLGRDKATWAGWVVIKLQINPILILKSFFYFDHEISGELELAVAEWVEQQSESIHVNRKTKSA